VDLMHHRTREWLGRTVLALSLVLGLFGGDLGSGDLVPRSVRAQGTPQVEVAPTSAAPGAHVTLFGSGWPAGITLRARIYREADVNGPGADLRMTFDADEAGRFTVDGVVPPTLFGAGARGNIEVTPGRYTIVVRSGPDVWASTPFEVMAAEPCHQGTDPAPEISDGDGG
jgi:hypothetical protein